MKHIVDVVFARLGFIKPLHVAFDSGNKNKPTVVLLHGIAADSGSFAQVINYLDTKKYRVIAIDLLGFGSSVKPAKCEYSVTDHVRYIRHTIKKLKIRGSFILAGHSMGSIIAARYALMYPNRIKKVFLLSPPIYVGEKTRNIVAKKKTDLYMLLYKFLCENKDFTITTSLKIRALLKIESGLDVNESNWHSFRLSLINTIVNQNTYADIKNLTCPVSIIYGDMDEFLIWDNIDHLDGLNNIKVTKLRAIDHVISKRFAKEAAKQISESI